MTFSAKNNRLSQFLSNFMGQPQWKRVYNINSRYYTWDLDASRRFLATQPRWWMIWDQRSGHKSHEGSFDENIIRPTASLSSHHGPFWSYDLNRVKSFSIAALIIDRTLRKIESKKWVIAPGRCNYSLLKMLVYIWHKLIIIGSMSILLLIDWECTYMQRTAVHRLNELNV